MYIQCPVCTENRLHQLMEEILKNNDIFVSVYFCQPSALIKLHNFLWISDQYVYCCPEDMKVMVTQTFCFLLYIHLIYIALGHDVLTGVSGEPWAAESKWHQNDYFK